MQISNKARSKLIEEIMSLEDKAHIQIGRYTEQELRWDTEDEIQRKKRMLMDLINTSMGGGK